MKKILSTAFATTFVAFVSPALAADLEKAADDGKDWTEKAADDTAEGTKNAEVGMVSARLEREEKACRANRPDGLFFEPGVLKVAA